jgi:hypothetical protein
VRKAALSLAVAHLVCVLLGALRLWPARPEGLTLSAAAWSFLTYSGADNDFAFFSPSVGDQIRARILVSDRAGRTRELRLSTPSNEVNLRIDSMVMATIKTKAEDLFARSWASTILADPQAARVAVVLEYYDTPSMPAFRQDRRGVWRETYRADFRHRADRRGSSQ